MNNKKELTKAELKMLKGEAIGIGTTLIGVGDVINKNRYISCICYYTNHSVITNDNGVSNCTCKCSY